MTELSRDRVSKVHTSIILGAASVNIKPRNKYQMLCLHVHIQPQPLAVPHKAPTEKSYMISLDNKSEEYGPY
jgi:hypothetical protein